jgi:hypothetical protein
MSELTDLQQQLADVRRQKATIDRQARDAKARRNERDVTRLAREQATLAVAERGVLDKLATIADPTKLVEQLDDSFPIMLFPLRLETRFKTHELRGVTRHELWIRVFPDDCQVQTFTDFISQGELRSVRGFWINFWKAGGVVAQQRAAWRGLVAAHGSGRAALLVERYTPVGTAPTKQHAEDVLLVVSPELALDSAQRAAAETYWIAFWRAGKDAHARDAARQALVAAVGGELADAIAASWRPGNLGDVPIAPHTRASVAVSVVAIELPPADSIATTPTSWQQAPRATTLPEYFVFTGLDATGKTVFEERGAQVPSVLAVGPDPSLPEDQQIKSLDGELVMNEDLRWLTDFDVAIARGMAIKISLTKAQYDAGFARLVVLGVRLGSDADDGAQLVEALFADHHASKSGLAILPQGTPTNNTDDLPSGYSWQDDPDASFERVFGQAADFALTSDPLAKRDGQWLADLLGIDIAAVRHIPHADGLDQAHARAMNTALWPTTWGYFFESMVGPGIPAATVEQLRTFFIRYISGRGAVPAIRIARQPYGILPATARSRLYLSPDTIPNSSPIPLDPDLGIGGPRPVPGPLLPRPLGGWSLDFLFAVEKMLDKIHVDFKQILGEVPQVGATTDSQQELLDVIGLHPTSVEYFSRQLLSIEQLLNKILLESGQFAHDLAAAIHSQLKGLREQLLDKLGLDPAEVPMLEKVLNDKAIPLRGAVVDDVALSETSPIRPYSKDGKNYLAWLATAGFDKVRREDFGGSPKPRALLYLVARYGVLMSYWDTSIKLLDAANLIDASAARREANFLHVGAEVDGASKWEPLVRTAPQITGSQKLTVAEHIDLPHVINAAAARRLRDVKDALLALANASTASLERLFAEHVDLCTYRLDAWRLGMVHHRLAQQRQRKARGVYVGAYGFLERVKPEHKELKSIGRRTAHPSFSRKERSPIVRDDQNGGYIHAPSINHATAAAILRNAYISHATPDQPGPMAVNLSSARVRTAMTIVQGMQHGQKLPELLGYQIERGLHDEHHASGLELEKFTYALREKFPLTANKHKKTLAPIGKLRHAGARTVLDGLALVEHVQATGSGYPYADAALPAASADERKAIDAIVNRAADASDAVADLMLAESVYQVVQGQTARAGNALDTIGRGARPQDPEVVRTPRGGTLVVHRVTLHLDDAAAGPAIATPRALAEPALEAWLAGRLPPPSEIACKVSWSSPVHGQHELIVTQAELGLSATDLLHLGSLDGVQQASDLDDRIERHVRGIAQHPAIRVLIRYTEPVPGNVSLFELAALIRSLRVIALESRALSAEDTVRAADVTSDGPRFDVGELAARVTAAIASLGARLAPIAAIEADATSSTELLLEQAATAFLAAGLHGIPETGIGAQRARIRELYETVVQKLLVVAQRWDERAAEYDALIASLPALPDDDVKRRAIAKAESRISATELDPRPDEVGAYLAAVAAKRSTFDAAHAALRAPLTTVAPQLADWFALVEPAVAAIATIDPVWFDIPREANDLVPEQVALALVGSDLRARAGSLRTAIEQRIAAAQALVTEAVAHADARAAVERLDRAARQVLGTAAKLVPRFTLAADPGAELRNAWGARAAILAGLEAAGREFPVDDWLYGIARVRTKLAHWETAGALAEAFGPATTELAPLQLPFATGDHWAALELPADYKLGDEKLLYTAHFATPFDDTRAQRGLVIDEWTEIIPGAEETTGIAFHFDQPNTEPPQAILLATPPHFSGGWKWADLMDTITETFEEARLRAIEPSHVAGSLYGQFLPATLVVLTRSLITISANFAENNL